MHLCMTNTCNDFTVFHNDVINVFSRKALVLVLESKAVVEVVTYDIDFTSIDEL